MRGVARWMAVILWAAGFLLLGYCGMSWLSAGLAQIEGSLKLDRALRHQAQVQPAAAPALKPSHGVLIGRVSIPRLALSAIVFEGTDDAVLKRGVGHLTGSALPGQPGNVVLAGHRDSFFRDLRNIRQGDLIDVTTEWGTHRYQVDSTEVVNPAEIGVEAPTRTPTLTLITCYPFYYVGSAPQRFIIRAEDVRDRVERTAADPPRPSRYVSYAVYADSDLK
jgi:sortase A